MWKFKNIFATQILCETCETDFHESLKTVSFTDIYFHIAQCGNCRNSLSHFIRKNFVKAMVLLRKLLNR